jgi:P4 family phage/plasmid primase-like protien
MQSQQYPGAGVPVNGLSEAHKQFLQSCAVNLQVAEEAGVFSCEKQSDLPPEFTYLNGTGHPALVFPWRTIDGSTTNQLRPNTPIPSNKKNGKASKYVWSAGKPLVISVHPRMVAAVNDPTIPLVQVEGTKQGLAAVSAADPTKLAVVSFASCWGWRQNENGRSNPVPCLSKIPLENREVIVAFDADLSTNPDVYQAATELGKWLIAYEGAASVKFLVDYASGTDGLDDVLAGVPEAKRQAVFTRLIKGAGKLPKRPSRAFLQANRFQAETFAKHCIGNLHLALAENKEIAVYTDGVYRTGNKLAAFCLAELGDDDSGERFKEICRKLQIMLEEDGKILKDRSDHLLINVKNGMLDPLTLNLLPHDPKYLSWVQLDVEWDTNAKCPYYDKWAAKQIGSQLDDLEEVASQMLDFTSRPNKIAWLFGPSRTGKSTYTNLMRTLVRGNSCSIGLQDLNNVFLAAELHGKILNIGGDLPASEMFNTSTLNKLTGEDPITAGKKYQGNFEFENFATLMFTANTIPPINGESESYLARTKPFRFDKSFKNAEDPKVKKALLAEMPGIFRRLVLALQHRINRGAFLPTDPSVRSEFDCETDRVLRWIAEMCVETQSPVMSLGEDLHREFQIWCRKEKLGGDGDDGRNHGIGRNKFYQRLRQWRVTDRSGPAATSPTTAFFLLRLRTKADDMPPRSSKTDDDTQTDEGTTAQKTCTDQGVDPSYVSFSTSKVESVRKTEEEEPEEGSGSTKRVYEEKPAKQPNPRSDNLFSSKPPVSDQSACSGNVFPQNTWSGNVCLVDFETADAKEIIRRPWDHPNGPFLRLFAYDDGTGPQTTSDPAVMCAVLRDSSSLVTHNGWAFDLLAAAWWFGLPYRELALKCRDLRVEATLAAPPIRMKGANQDRYDLGSLGTQYCGVTKTDGLKILKRKYKQYDLIPVDHPDYIEYAKQDIVVTGSLADALPEADKAYLERERQIAVIAGEMTLCGVKIDTDLVESRFAQREQTRLNLLAQLVSYDFPDTKQPWSTKTGKQRLVDLLAERNPEEEWPETDKGAVSVTGEIFEMLSQTDDTLGRVSSLILAIAQPHPFLNQVRANLIGDRVHPQYKIINATGRWSSSDPNVLGVGKRTDLLLQDRDLVIADSPDQVLISVDLSGIDARCVAGLSGDRDYAALFEPGVDIHTEISKMFYGTPDKRDPAKAISHGINYGRMPRAISMQTGEPYHEVANLHRRYFERFAGIQMWHDEVRAVGAAGAFLPVGSGRFVRVDPDNAHTEAPARLAQSAARDLAMDGLLALECAGLLPYLRLFVHDEVILSVPKDQADDIAKQAAEAMSFPWHSPSGLIIPIIAEPGKGYGYRWSDCYRKGN